MSNLELVALVVRDYDAAIDFFVDVLRFELVEDRPSLTSDGRPKRWVVVRLHGGQTGILLARADGDHQASIVGQRFAGRVGCSSAWTTSRPRISAWLQRAFDSSRRLATSRTGSWRCSSTWKETAGTS